MKKLIPPTGEYIELSNEIDADIYRNNKDILLLIAKEYGNNCLICDKQRWAEKKICEYIAKYQDSEEKREPIHVDFVRELAKLSSDYKFNQDIVRKVKYREKGSFDCKQTNVLTLGSAYGPICDFEANGIKDLHYLSEDYIYENNIDTIKSFFKNSDIHQNMTEKDVALLVNRDFAIYFWSNCFSNRLSEYTNWIKNGVFNYYACIPTEDGIKKCSDLYSPLLDNYANQSPNYKDTVPYIAMFNKLTSEAKVVFYSLPFKDKLSLEDCLYYLLNARDRKEEEKINRKKILDWILKSPQIDKALISNYRNNTNARWRNYKNQWKPIIELYALHPKANDEKSIFSGSDYVMMTNSFPDKEEDFERICKILEIECLKSENFTTKPINPIDETDRLLSGLRSKLLVLAVIADNEKYAEKFKQYTEEIRKYRFYVCNSIEIFYKNLRNDILRIWSGNNNVYYVKSWLNNRTYTKFCSKIRDIIDRSIPDNIYEDILDESVPIEECLVEYCQAVRSETKFSELLNECDCVVDDFVEEEETMDDGSDVYISKPQPVLRQETQKQKTDTTWQDDSISRAIQHVNKHNSYTSSGNGPTYRSNNGLASHPKKSYGSRNIQYEPKPFSKEDIAKMKSKAVVRCLEVQDASPIEIEQLNTVLGVNMTAEEIADTNYLVQMRLYQYLKKNDMDTKETERDFIVSDKANHSLSSGKYIHKCSASFGVLYISPNIWNMLADDRCIICVYVGKKSNDFILIKSQEELLEWIDEDDIIIKLTGPEKVDVVNELYSGTLNNVSGTAYTMIRLASNELYNPVFEQFEDNSNQEEDVDNY